MSGNCTLFIRIINMAKVYHVYNAGQGTTDLLLQDVLAAYCVNHISIALTSLDNNTVFPHPSCFVTRTSRKQ